MKDHGLMKDSFSCTCCFTGHRPGHGGTRFVDGDAVYLALLDVLDRAILELYEQHGIENFLCGMADGFDLVAAKRVLALRRTGQLPKEVRLIAVQPFPEHVNSIRGMRWQKDYDEVLQCADDVCVVCKEYNRTAYGKRNEFMVAHSAWVICYWDGMVRSGTGQTVRMAEKAERMMVNLFGI